MQFKQCRMVIYKSKRDDWGLAVVDACNATSVLTYESTINNAQRVARCLFNQELVWYPRSGEVTHETDHPGVSFSETVHWLETFVNLVRL